MEYNLKQVTLEFFLKDYLPGPNIPKKHLKSLHYVADLAREPSKVSLYCPATRTKLTATDLIQVLVQVELGARYLLQATTTHISAPLS